VPEKGLVNFSYINSSYICQLIKVRSLRVCEHSIHAIFDKKDSLTDNIVLSV